jgi:ribosome biogenesis GTPase / thiamine phosphate phosphatase
MDPAALGWDDDFAQAFALHAAAGLQPARVAVEFKHEYDVYTFDGPCPAVCTGRLLETAAARAGLPVVGDWVAVSGRPGELMVDIHAVLPRRTKFARRAAGPHDTEQVIAANVDTVFLVSGLDANFNPRRLERYLAVAWASGAQPVVVLNKSDLRSDLEQVRREVNRLAAGAPVVITSALATRGLKELRPWLERGRTVAFLGSSGVGKSSLINGLRREAAQVTQEVRGGDAKGRHTTSVRELMITPAGALVIDTPGMRELQLWDAGHGVVATFPEIAMLAARCKFRDCRHGPEPGCAVQAALADDSMDPGRWQSYLKLQREQSAVAARRDLAAAARRKQEWKKLSQGLRERTREKNG